MVKGIKWVPGGRTAGAPLGDLTTTLNCALDHLLGVLFYKSLGKEREKAFISLAC